MSDNLLSLTPVCTFCHGTADDRDWLVFQAPAFICDQCIDLCAEIIAEKRALRSLADRYAETNGWGTSA